MHACISTSLLIVYSKVQAPSTLKLAHELEDSKRTTIPLRTGLSEISSGLTPPGTRIDLEFAERQPRINAKSRIERSLQTILMCRIPELVHL